MKEDDFIEAFKEALEIEDREVGMNENFRDYDEWDSLSQLSLIAMLDENYGVEIEMKDFNELLTVQALFNEVKKRKG